jgi:hypothetical protein
MFFSIMKHTDQPLETVWYYVATYKHYFPYIEHRPNGILLDGTRLCGRVFVAPFGTCREAPYEEVEAFYNS